MRALAIATLLAVVACGDSESAAPDPCADLYASCLVDQMSCAVTDAGPACVHCGTGEHASREGGCRPIAGTPLSHDFPETATEPGGEILGLCRSWTLDNDAPLYVNAVELEQDEASHHSNWTFVPESEFDGPDGLWPCSERGYDQLSAALAGGVLYAQSTQAKREVQKFPDGVVVRLPARARIISDVHTLNTSTQPVSGHARLTIYTLAEGEVRVKLTPFHLTYDGLAIPPRSESRFSGECAIGPEYQRLTGQPTQLELYYLLPHTHALGTRMFVEAVGGAADGRSLIDVRGFNGEARGRYFDPPIDLAGVEALRFGCEFVNPRDETVHWGFDDQEMCETLGFAASPLAFESRIEEAVAGPADGDILTFSGACASLVFPWQTDK